MSARSFSVPLATLALSTTVTASCSSGGLIGQWMMTEWESYGSDYSSSLEATSYTTDDGCTYTRHDTLWLEFDDRDGRTYTGQYAQGYASFEGESCRFESSFSYSDSFEADKRLTGRYKIVIESGWMLLDLRCTLDEDELSCEDDPNAFAFARE